MRVRSAALSSTHSACWSTGRASRRTVAGATTRAPSPFASGCGVRSAYRRTPVTIRLGAEVRNAGPVDRDAATRSLRGIKEATSNRAEVVRVIRRGETIKDLIDELARRTFQSGGREHAIVSMQDGHRLMVQGNSQSIELMPEVRRLFIHTHPKTTGPSDGDFEALRKLGQRSSWIYEMFGGGLQKFSVDQDLRKQASAA